MGACAAVQAEHRNPNLKYREGGTLGEGSFGVVRRCTHRATGEEFAVKKVGKSNTPFAAIQKEVDIMQSLDHPNIVKFHDYFCEGWDVCIVMDKYEGGSLVECLDRYGKIPCDQILHVARQMAVGINYLHSQCVIHRDIKGDNFLLDRGDLTDPACRIVLIDFGLARTVKPEQRLSSAVGTELFWAPEVFDQDYGLKIDVWAMGVVVYGLVSSCFPFNDERSIRTKVIEPPGEIIPACRDFIKRMLDKREASRPSSCGVMNHLWLNPELLLSI